MLKQITIQNYALIDSLEVSWQEGFTVITGETGSGKSILLGALGLVLGKRADTSVLKKAEKKCIVEAVFNLSRFSLRDFFTSNDLDYDENTTLRREISPTGKSRAFINDTPVNLIQLREISAQLIDIHSQHQTLSLRNNQFQLEVLDDFANLTTKTTAYNGLFEEWRSLSIAAEKLKAEIVLERQNRDFRNFQLEELIEAALAPEEVAENEAELDLLLNAENLKSALVAGAELMSEGEVNITLLLRQCLQRLDVIHGKSAEFDELYERIKSVAIETEDIAEELIRKETNLEADQQRVNLIQERLDLIYRLQHKHGVQDVNALIEIREKIDAELQQENDREEELDQLNRTIAAKEGELHKLADQLHKERTEAAGKLGVKLEKVLVNLEMKNAEVKVNVIDLNKLVNSGKSGVEIWLKANKGHDFLPLDQAASGGELSRVMLAVKSLNTGKNASPTLILDEIDTGVSGKVASAMANVLEEMGKGQQLICITHLPQIAARGSAHFKVFKTDKGAQTYTGIVLLEPSERLQEIAGMLSGSDTTPEAVENARMLLQLH
jgi:DNA repair protein RecN (Recombination protein N)